MSSSLLHMSTSFATQNLRQMQKNKIAEAIGDALSVSDDDTVVVASGGVSVANITGAAEHENVITPSAIARSLRVAFEQNRSTPIEQIFKGHAWYPSLATWFNATRNVIATMHDKITVYYPGAGSDILYPLLATDGDIFIFADLYAKTLPKELISSVRKNGGKILKIRRGIIRRNEYYLEFFIFGKKRKLYYCCGINAAKEGQLPQRVKDGFNVYIARRVSEGYGNMNVAEILPLSLKYLADKGFTITDYRISQFRGRANLLQIGYTRYGEIYSFNFYLKPYIYTERILVIDITEERAEAIKAALVSKRTLPDKNIYAIGQPQPGQAIDEALRQKYGEVPIVGRIFNNISNVSFAFGSLADKLTSEFGHIEDINEVTEKITMWL